MNGNGALPACHWSALADSVGGDRNAILLPKSRAVSGLWQGYDNSNKYANNS